MTTSTKQQKPKRYDTIDYLNVRPKADE